jgi:peptidoglycan/xylan/chitin deacetylase (PgdA/CDA1 family)
MRGLDRAGGGVALSFDDGPDPLFTPPLLGILSDHGVKATFFLLGQHVEARPDLAREVAREGHAIGSHSWSHPVPWETRPHALLRDYRKGRRVVEGVIGQRVHLFRAPTGYIGPVGTAVTMALGLRPWGWTVDPGDWNLPVSSDELLERTADLGAGDVVLLHDGMPADRAPQAVDRSATIGAVPTLIERVRARGLAFATLS